MPLTAGEVLMRVIRFEGADSYEPEDNWKRVSLCGEEDISIEYFVKPPGHASPNHDHANAQVLVVLEGELSISAGGREEILTKGDAVYIPGDESHVITNTLETPSVGLDIFVPGRSFDFWLKRKR
jgi:quercetin dioxygenase-like cupin family protein